jgi:hypothetical protein
MKTGSLVLTFKDGLVVDASVGAGLQESYNRLFEAARANLVSDTTDVDVSVRLIVFGCMLVEALAADYLEDLLHAAAIPPSAGNALVDAVDRSPVGQKLKVIAGFDKEVDTPDWIGPVYRAFQVRNRLMHFRERFVAVTVPTTVHSIESWVDEIPEADLLGELRKPRIEQTATALLGAKKRLDDIRDQYFPTDKIELNQSIKTAADAV